MKTAWLTVLLSNIRRRRLWLAIPYLVAITAFSLLGCLTGFSSPIDLILISWFTMAMTVAITWTLELCQLPADMTKSMPHKGEVFSAAWIVGANAMVPIVFKAVMVCDLNDNPLGVLLVLIGGCLLLASVLIIQYFYRRLRKSSVAPDNNLSEPEA